MERVVGTVPEGGVVLALGQIQQAGFLVFHQFDVHAVDVGQLVAGGIHFPVVGVAHQHRALAGRELLRLPGQHRGVSRIFEPVAQQLELLPVAGLGQAGVELFQVMAGLVQGFGLPEALRHDGGRDPVRLVPGPLHGVVVDELHVHGFAGGLEAVPGDGDDAVVVVGGQVLPPEAQVVGGEGRAVGPAQACAQGVGDLGAVVVESPVLEQARFVAGIVGLPAHRRVVRDHPDIAESGLPCRRAPGAAVLADFVHDRDRHVVLGQALLDRRQFARGHHGRQHRRFSERGCRRGLLHAENGRGGTRLSRVGRTRAASCQDQQGQCPDSVPQLFHGSLPRQ